MQRERLAAFVAVLAACCSLFGRGVCQQPTVSDCITTVTLSVPGLSVDVVPPGVVCFNCSIQGMVATTVMYTIGGDDIPMDEGMVEAGGILAIFDTDVTFDPTNFMTVRCANDDGFSQTTVLVNVFIPPIITGDTTINEGDTLDLWCDTSNSLLQPQAQWFNGDGLLLTDSARLQIEDIDRSEAGMYTCRTNTPNSDDSTNTTVTVVIQWLGPVRELEAEALNSTAIRVTWMEPLINSDTTAPVQQYRISYISLREGEADIGVETTQPDVTDITLANLLMGTLYEIVVVSVNTAGDGDESSVERSTAIDPPSVPQEFESKVLDPFSISVSWEEPEIDGGRPVVRYDLSITEAGATESVMVGLSALQESYTFTDLSQDTTYIISIRAVNRDSETGDERSGSAVELVNTTLPVGPPQTPAQPQSSLVTNVSVRISWTNPGGYPDNYTLEIKLSVEEWTSPNVIRVPGLTSLSHDQDGLVTLSRYEARVLSINFNGPSDFSESELFNTVGMISVDGGADAVDNTLETMTGETVTLTCTLSQLEEEVAVNYIWTRRDGRPLPDGSHESGGELTITKARTEDSGVYVCSANGVEGVFSLSVIEVRESGVSESSSGSTTIIVVGVACSLTFGVLLEAVGV